MRFIYHDVNGNYPVGTPSRDLWIDAVARGMARPKPPEWWLDFQEQNEGRSRTTSSIIWGRNYSAARKATIWSQAPDSDFIALGYMEE